MLLSFPTLKPLFLLIAENISLPNYRNFRCAVCVRVLPSLREDLGSGLCAGGAVRFQGVRAALASGEGLWSHQNSLCVPPSFRISGAARGPRHSRYCPLRSSACVVSAGPSAVATRPSGPLVSPPRHPSLCPSLSSRSVCPSALRLWGLPQGLANMPRWPGSGE